LIEFFCCIVITILSGGSMYGMGKNMISVFYKVRGAKFLSKFKVILLNLDIGVGICSCMLT